MGRGRKKLPQEVLELRGTARKDRTRPPAGVSKSGVAEIQCWTVPGYSILPERAQKIYRKLCRTCIALKILEVQDLPQLIAYAREFDIYLDATEDIKDNGFKYHYIDKTGNIKYSTNPSVAVANAALKNLGRIGSNFGFSPVDRQKLRFQKEEDPMEKIKRAIFEFKDDDEPDDQ